MEKNEISIAEAKAHFSDIINRVVYGHEQIVITRRGKPVAIISATSGKGLASIKGWLPENDSFFQNLQKIEKKRHSARLRASK